MCEILRRAQRSLGTWIGSSVVHLGDHNVPNALTFIDKYTQVWFIKLYKHYLKIFVAPLRLFMKIKSSINATVVQNHIFLL